MEIMELLYKISELCKDNNINVEISHGYLIIKWFDFHNYEKPLAYKQAFSLVEIENYYKTLENVLDEFLTRRDKALEKMEEGSGAE